MSPLSVHQLAAIAAVLLGGGYLLFAALVALPATRTKGLEILRIFFGATLIVACLAGLFLIGPPAILPAFTLISARVGYEAAFARFGTPRAALVVAGLAAVLALAAMSTDLAAPLLLGVWALALPRVGMARRPYSARDAALLDVLAFPVLPCALLAYGAVHPTLAAGMFAAYILVEIFDSFALLFGQLFGRTPAFPRLSPRKTVEGLLGGGLCLLLALLVGAFIWDFPLWQAMLLALLIGGLALIGDLAGSRLKRDAKIKDFPHVLRRQGGLLDSLDSWIAAASGVSALAILLRLL